MPYEEERPLVFSFASIKSHQSERHAGAAAGEQSPAAFFIGRNGLRPRPEDPDIPVTWQLHGGYMRGGAFRGSKRKGQWSKCALQIVLFVGFVEKR